MITSPNDKKQYQTLTLSNGLRTLLIHNAESTKSAAALAVNVGHFSDPKHRQGLAHFLEHMLFLGTEQYPDGSEYQQFISQYGGNNNAWTGTEHTCFFFDIHHQHFPAALDRFSQFFIAPLLSEEFIYKERQNIDAEFKLKLKDDIRRLYDVHKETINPAHPFSQFSVGNIETLADKADSNVQQELKTFFDSYYCAEYMTLAIEGPQPLTELAALAEKHFATIKQAHCPLPAISAPLYLPEHQQINIQVCPVKNDRQLILSFAMPSIDQYYQNKPEGILAYLIGHEGPGSILSLLKQKHWAFRLTAGSGINGSNFKDFNISIALSEEGEQHIDDIISIVFSYIKLLTEKPLATYYFNEKKSIAMLSFNYQEPLKPLDSVSQYVINMQHYPPEDYIFGDYMMTTFDQTQVSTLLDYLSASNLRLIHISQDNEFSKTSQWYQVPYQVTPIDKKMIQKWQNSPIHPSLFLPPPNLYTTDNPTLVEPDEQQVIPKIIYQEKGLTAWFKQDQSFNVPKGYIYLSIDCPKALASIENIAMTRLFIELYSDNVLEENYDAELAGIHYHLYAHQSGVTLQISGVSEKQPLLLEKLLQALSAQKFCENTFHLFKKQLISHCKDAEQSKSISLLFSILSSTMQPKKPSSEKLAEALAQITFEQFTQFSQTLFDEISLELLVHGNWRKNDAINITEQIRNIFNGQYSDEHIVKIGVIDNKNQQEQILPLIVPDHDHAAVIYYPLASKTIDTIATAMVLSQLYSPHFFQQMRTEKQFGYLVGVGYVPMGYYPGIAFYIQSPHTKGTILTTAIDEFIINSLTFLNDMPEQHWLQLRHGLCAQLQENDTSLRIKSQRFWASICNQDYDFNRKNKLIESIKKLTLSDINNFIKEHLAQTSAHNRLCLLSVKSAEDLTDIAENKLQTPEKIQAQNPLKF